MGYAPFVSEERIIVMYYGAIEAGGTKMVCAVGNEKAEIIKQIELPTRSPDETMPEMLAFFQEYTLEG